MIKIFISGKKGTGKDTLSLLMKNDLEKIGAIKYNKIISKSFADPVKKIAKLLFPQIPEDHLYGPSENRSLFVEGLQLYGNPVSVRDVLIDIGQNFKKYDKGIFVRVFNEDYNYLYSLDDSHILFVTDVRFPVELEYLKKQGFTGIRIKRKNIEKLKTTSETALDHVPDSEFDYVINNDNDLSELNYASQNIVSDILKI